MTDFERKRLSWFIKAAEKSEWIRLAKADAEMFLELIEGYKETIHYDKGFEDGIKYVTSGEMAFDEQKKDALKDIY